MIRPFKLSSNVVSVIVACETGLCLSPAHGMGKPWEPTGKETSASMNARTSDINRPKEPGTYYKAVVPDTLDLAERAWLGISHFTSIISEKDDCEMYWSISPFGGSLWQSPLQACQAKAMEAMAMERLMSGSQKDLELEARMLNMMESQVGDEGIYWVVPTGGRKPWLGPEDQRPNANVHGQGRMMRAMIAWHQYTGNPKWKRLIDRMVEGLDRLMVVHKDDYAYFPTQGWMPEEYFRSCYIKGRGWKDTREPVNEKDGEEGSLFNHQGHIAGALANWHKLTGNKQALRLSGELVRFLTKSKFWADNPGAEYPGVPGADHAHWQGHYTGAINTLRAILEYAIAANDVRLKEFVRDGYEWSRGIALSRIGFNGAGCCGHGRLLGLAVKLSDAGVADYWEDVDLYIRNGCSELQNTPEDLPYLMETVDGRSAPQERHANATIGGFAFQIAKGGSNLCCGPHGNMGLFYAWDGIIRYDNGTARINLLLNRASPWMDIDSYLPYEGKVALKNKTAREAYIRIPLWVDHKAVRCTKGPKKAPIEWFDNYIFIGDLRPGDTLTVSFPMAERTEKWAMHNILSQPVDLPDPVVYTIKFMGNTVIDMLPQPILRYLSPNRPLLFQREYDDKAPMKEAIRYVSPTVLKW